MNYLDFFQFFLHVPIALFEEVSDKQIQEDCLEMKAYPIVIIKDIKHPLFVRFSKDFKNKGITQELKSIVLAIGYNTPYLS
jgi:hypothetical protein